MNLNEAKRILNKNGYMLIENSSNPLDELAAALPQKTEKAKYGLRVFKSDDDDFEIAYIHRTNPYKPYSFIISFSKSFGNNTWKDMNSWKNSIEDAVAFIDELDNDDTILNRQDHVKFGNEWTV